MLRVATMLILMSGSATAPVPDVLDTSICDLMARPLYFANRIVRVHATLHASPESITASDYSCPHVAFAQPVLWLEKQPAQPDVFVFSRDWTSQQFVQAWQSGELTGSGPAVEWQSPAGLTPLDAHELKELGRMLRKASKHPTPVVIIGRYDYVGNGLLIKAESGSFSFRLGYGYLGVWLGQIVLQSVVADG